MLLIAILCLVLAFVFAYKAMRSSGAKAFGMEVAGAICLVVSILSFAFNTMH
jgi:Flp pilus assembly protein protease CpaA